MLINSESSSISLALNFIGALKNEDYYICSIIKYELVQKIKDRKLHNKNIDQIIQIYNDHRSQLREEDIENAIEMLQSLKQ